MALEERSKNAHAAGVGTSQFPKACLLFSGDQGTFSESKKLSGSVLFEVP